MIKEILKLWNDNFNKGVTVFQMCLMATMILGAILSNEKLVLFSMTACIFGYFEPTNDRFSFAKESNSAKEKE